MPENISNTEYEKLISKSIDIKDNKSKSIVEGEIVAIENDMVIESVQWYTDEGILQNDRQYLRTIENLSIAVDVGFEGLSDNQHPYPGEFLLEIYRGDTLVKNTTEITGSNWLVETTTPFTSGSVTWEIILTPTAGGDLGEIYHVNRTFIIDPLAPVVVGSNIEHYDHRVSSNLQYLSINITDQPVLPANVGLMLWTEWANDLNGNNWPDEGEFIERELNIPPNLNTSFGSYTAFIDDTAGFPGEKVVLAENLNAANAVLLDAHSWALRWSRNVKPKDAEPLAEIRWFKSSDEIDWGALAEWTNNVETGGRIPELLIVDEEHGVVTYRCRLHNPSGPLTDPFRGLDNDERRTVSHAWAESKETEGGFWLNISREKWPVVGVGINLEGGIWISEIESRIVSRIVNPTMPLPTGKTGNRMEILSDLLSRGIAVRSGFKYGTRWRAYAGLVGGEHAPWLVVPLDEAPTDWGEACLAARLAAGVNKYWLCAMDPLGNSGWRYLALERPPPDSRWTNPVRH